MSVMWNDVENKLIKAKRKYIPIDCRRAELFCVECDVSLGIHDLVYDSHESLKYCNECVKKFIKETPRHLTDNIIILSDFGNSVIIRYGDIRQEHNKNCYFNSRGRFKNYFIHFFVTSFICCNYYSTTEKTNQNCNFTAF